MPDVTPMRNPADELSKLAGHSPLFYHNCATAHNDILY
jgi:hypothetical protein